MKKTVTFDFEPASGPPAWPTYLKNEGLVWDPTGDPDGGSGRLAFECMYAFQDVSIPFDPPELQACYDALERGGPLACAGFSNETRGLLAHLLQSSADDESEGCNYEASRCLDALRGIDPL